MTLIRLLYVRLVVHNSGWLGSYITDVYLLSEVFKINLYSVFLTVRAQCRTESAEIALITSHSGIWRNPRPIRDPRIFIITWVRKLNVISVIWTLLLRLFCDLLRKPYSIKPLRFLWQILTKVLSEKRPFGNLACMPRSGLVWTVVNDNSIH